MDDNLEFVETAATTRGSMRGTREVVRGRRRTRRRRAEIGAEEEGKCCLIAVTELSGLGSRSLRT